MVTIAHEIVITDSKGFAKQKINLSHEEYLELKEKLNNSHEVVIEETQEEKSDVEDFFNNLLFGEAFPCNKNKF